MSIGGIIKRERKKRGLSQSDLAKILHISRNTLCTYEQNKITPNYVIIKKLIDIFHLDARELFDND